MKQKFIIMLAIVACILCFGSPALAATQEVTKGDFTYVFDDVAKTAEVTYYMGVDNNVAIPSSIEGYKVTTIGMAAFANSDLESITIPDSVTSIGDGAFKNCARLNSIIIPDSVTSIGNNAFECCFGLKSITLSDNLKSIGNRAFKGCNNLMSITIPDSVISIGNSAFESCVLLNSITIPNNVTSIGNSAFKNCMRLTSITIPDNVTSIGSSAFANISNLTSVTLSNKVPSIEDGTFESCSSLKSITIPDSVTTIGSNAFMDCSGLTSITIPDSVTSIGNTAFAECSKLSSITLSNNLKSIGNAVFGGCFALTSITIPYSVTSIASNVFINCTGLTSIYYQGTEEDWTPIAPTSLGVDKSIVKFVAIPVVNNNTIGGENPVSAATSTGTAIIGMIQPQIISAVVPTSIAFDVNANKDWHNTINESTDKAFVSPAFDIQNASYCPINVKVSAIEATDGMPSVVTEGTYTADEWQRLSKSETYSNIAFGFTIPEGFSWKTEDNRDAWYVPGTPLQIGSISRLSSGKLALKASYGMAWNTEDPIQYGIVYEISVA